MYNKLKNRLSKILIAIVVVSFVSITIASTSENTNNSASNIYSFEDIDYIYTTSIPNPDSSLHYPLPQEGGPESPLHLKNPSNITTTVEYKPETNDYLITTQAGGVIISRRYMTFDEYQDWQMDQLMQKYWSQQKKSAIQPNENGDNILNQLLPGLSNITGKLDNMLNQGKPLVEINPSGSAELTFAIVNNKREDPGIDINKRSVTNFDFTENIQVNLNAKIGDIIDFDINHNTQAVFDFENKVKLKYEGKEDDILQVLEAGDVSLPLQTKLIQGSESLFGIRSKLKFGKLTVDAVVSNQETESQNMQVQGGAQTEEFEFKADQYEENRHFFLAQYFYDNYNNAMSTLPVINSKINILKIEVWRTNIGSAVTENRNILALTDLGERKPSNPQIPQGNSTLPDNYRSNMMFNVLDKNAVRSINNISSYMQNLGMTSGKDYEKVESARRLSESEYTFNPRLGFISLNQPLSSDQVLAVAFQYQVIGDSTIYQVGELTTDGVVSPNTLVVKLLKSTTVNTRGPLWKLMMKNVYFLKSTQISQEKFRLNILYEGDEGGVPSGYYTDGPKKGIPLIELFGLDRVDGQQNPYPDGVFDWLDNAASSGGIIQSSTGRIYFPYVEPFGKDLRALLGDNEAAKKYCFDSLYTLTKTMAQQYPDQNKYYLEGSYTTAMSGEISLGFNIPQGSVRVTAGGIPLIEDVDYTVDYMMGKVRIINESILNSGTPISISSESNSFSMMTKTMLGMHLNYEIDPKFNVGATLMNLSQKPLTAKNNFGDEPISNTMWGVDLNYEHEVPFITKMVDWLPGIQTKEMSTLTINAEFAHFIPGIANTGDEKGVSYIDDFEAAKSSIDLMGVSYWNLASTPQDVNTPKPLFPETAADSKLAYGFNRAKLAWYRIDDIFYSSNSPSNITVDDKSYPYSRRITEQEVFPNKELAAGQATNIYELNLAYYPSERGPYNYDVAQSSYSAGANSDGTLKNPASRWGGIMRKLDYTDFETQNIETIEFWVMDPFIENPNHTGGKLYFNLGDISEDILRDGRKSYENGLPTSEEVTNVDTTIWGRVPTLQALVNAFDNNEDSRKYQDIGYDGLNSNDEASFFETYLNNIANIFGADSPIYQVALNDPSNDDYTYFRSTRWDNEDVKINDRYKYFNNPEGNSPVSADNTEGYTTAATSNPNIEDINRDNTLSETENYYEYSIDLDPTKMVIGENYITDIQVANNIKLPNGEITSCKWYQFKIPIRNPERKVGSIDGFQSIRFVRMFMKDFEEPIILRFATLELVYGTWRKYDEDLLQPGDYPTGVVENTDLILSTVNIEENGSREPVPYVLPPGIERESWYSSTSSYQLNEQSIQMSVQNLASGDARAIYKNTDYDFRYFKNLKMFVHAEKMFETDYINDNDLSLFVRIGTDFTSNYYEYEVPLKLTPWGTGSSDQYAIWPEDNNVIIDLEKLVEVKENRNKAMRSGNSDYTNSTLYSEYHGNRKYTVLGTPNIGSVRVIMVGIRNPKKESLTDGNNMLPKSIIVWINELRLSDYSSKGGWAATALARTNLADLGDFSVYGAYTSAGFGSLSQSFADLKNVNQTNFELALNLELGKLLPENWGVKLPMHFDYSNQIGSPEYNPLDPDVLLYDDLETYSTKEQKDSIKAMTQERLSRTNINFMNVRKERINKSKENKTHFYDIENFNFSYAYSSEKSQDIDIEYYNKTQHRGGFGYNYTLTPKAWKPFDKVKLFQHKNWKILKELNLYYQLKNVMFRTEMFRNYEETKLRNKSSGDIILRPTYYKQFTWDRIYNIQYDLTKNLRLTYDATANARIDEPIGKIDTRTARDSIWESIGNMGTMQNFNQSINANWDVPINKLPYLDFLRMPLSYRTQYTYMGTTAALARMGSTIENSSTFTARGDAMMDNFYKKFKFIKKAYEQPNQKQETRPRKNDKAGLNLKGRDPKMKEKEDVADSTEESAFKKIMREVGYFGIRFATGLKSASIQYTYTAGTLIPGFMPEATIFGLDNSNKWAPGLGFVLGGQGDIIDFLLQNDYLSTDSLMNTPHEVKSNTILAIQASLEPIRDMKIDITFAQNKASDGSFYYKYDNNLGYVNGPITPMNTGNYTSTVWMFSTAFTESDELFAKFVENRNIMAQRYANINPDPLTDEMIYDTMANAYFPGGYNSSSQQVLLSAFLATYTGKDAKEIGLSPFFNFPLPNWSISYNGLNKIKWLQKWFTNIAMSHRYSSTYTIGNYYTDARIANIANYDYGIETILNDISGNFIPKESIEQVQLTEQFSPLIKLDMSMKNNVQANFEIRKNRTLSMSFANNQLTETTRDAIVIGAGYRFKDVAFSFKTADRTVNLKSDIVLRADITRNINKTMLRQVDQNISQVSSGSEVWTIGVSAEYSLTQNLTVRAFFESTINTPYISNSYPNATTKGGLTARFSF